MRVWFYSTGCEYLEEAAMIEICDSLSDELTDLAERTCWSIIDDDFNRPSYSFREIDNAISAWVHGIDWRDYGYTNSLVMSLLDGICYISTDDLHDLED